jgi:hypothetical protein
MRKQRSVGALAGAGIQDVSASGHFLGGGREMFEQLSMKWVKPAHEETGNQGLDQLAEFGFKHSAPSRAWLWSSGGSD